MEQNVPILIKFNYYEATFFIRILLVIIHNFINL